ncbi:hypothetical protein BHECKSOX_196, partial [Bathymodiolus heckerae thiotrophic gill symbiont]|uniref:hypothetical protein n=1 Tax=Bathymodiolus heckerae thiotrophic gill symbiont TaxID=1052212 RepID=UPI0010B570C4
MSIYYMHPQHAIFFVPVFISGNFLTLFLVTSLWSKALKFMVGSMLWLTTWGIMSAVAHAGVMDA